MRLTQRKGDIAVSEAVSTFTKFGFDVSIPLTESACYDLVVDSIIYGLKRVQVKYTSKKDVDLRRVHSNSLGYVVKKAQENAYDWLYVYREPNEYLFMNCYVNRRSVRPFDKDLFKNVIKTQN